MSGVFEALGEPARRHILELLSAGERSVGDLVESMQERAPMSQPAVSQHLRVLREARLVHVRAEHAHRFYSVDETGLAKANDWLARVADPVAGFAQPLEALATEVARGKRARRSASQDQAEDRSNERGSRPA